MDEHEVVVIGGGPTGMMLAAELALGGADGTVLERRPDATLVGSRAGGSTPAPSRSSTSAGWPTASWPPVIPSRRP